MSLGSISDSHNVNCFCYVRRTLTLNRTRFVSQRATSCRFEGGCGSFKLPWRGLKQWYPWANAFLCDVHIKLSLHGDVITIWSYYIFMLEHMFRYYHSTLKKRHQKHTRGVIAKHTRGVMAIRWVKKSASTDHYYGNGSHIYNILCLGPGISSAWH